MPVGEVQVPGNTDWEMFQLGDVSVGGSASWKKSLLRDVPVGGVPGRESAC